MNAADRYSPHNRSSKFPFVTNPYYGFEKFHRALAGRADPYGASALGGTDIVVLGSSLSAGAGCASMLDAWPHLVKVALQARYNPTGVTGGFGFHPAAFDLDCNGTFTIAPGGTLESGVTIIDGGFGAKCVHLPTYVDAVKRARWFFNAGVAEHRMEMTSLEIVSSKIDDNDGDVKYDLSDENAGASGTADDAYTTIASQTVKGTISCDGGALGVSATYGFRTNIAAPLAIDNCLQIGVTTGNKGGPIEGFFLYNGDESAGVRVHNASQYNLLATARNAAQQTAIFTAAAGGAKGKYGSLFVIEGGAAEAVAEAATPGTISVADFKTHVAALVRALLGKTTKPNVVIMVPPAPNDAAGFAIYGEYANAMASVASENDVACVNFWEAFRKTAYAGEFTEAGFHHASIKTGGNEKWQRFVADVMLAQLVAF